MSIKSVTPSDHLILCLPLLLLPLIFPSIRVFSNELALPIRSPKYWSFRFSTSPSTEYSGLISFRIDWFDLLAAGLPLWLSWKRIHLQWGRPAFGRSPGEGKGYPLQYSGLENSIDCIVDGVAKSWTWQSNFHFVQGTLKSLLQHHSSKASILQCSAFCMIQLSHPYMTTGKTIAWTIQTFVSKVMSLIIFFIYFYFFLVYSHNLYLLSVIK